MGFHQLAQQTSPQDLCRQSVGAYLIFIGAWLCWESIVLSRDAWWRDPDNTGNFAKKFRKSGRWISFFENHPATISEMIGDQKRAQGAVAFAVALPACMMSLAGGLFLWQGWPVTHAHDREFMYFVNMLRAIAQPIGFLMVLLTPTITLDRDKYGIAKKDEDRSEIEEAWHSAHMNIHGVGFVLAVVIPAFVEVGFLVADVRWYFFAGVPRPEDLNWHPVARCVWCGLVGLRGVATLGQVATLVTFVRIMGDIMKLDEPGMTNYKKWNCEYATLVLSGLVPMYCGASTLVFANHGTPDVEYALSSVIIFLFLLESARCTLGFLGCCDERWSGMMALRDFNSIDFEQDMLDRFSGDNVPVLLRGLKAASGMELMSINVAQAGETEVFPFMPQKLGSALPKVQLIVFSPGVMEEVRALRFEQLSDEDLRYFHQDLARMLQLMPSAYELVIPFGNVYKWRKMPIACLLLKAYEEDLSNIDDDVVPNTDSYWEWRTTWGSEDPAKDITQQLRATTPMLGIWQRDLLSQLEAGATLRPLYETLQRELSMLGEFTVHLKGLVGAAPNVVVIVNADTLRQARPCPMWDAGVPVATFPPGTLVEGGDNSTDSMRVPLTRG